jgi:hypothetical protein
MKIYDMDFVAHELYISTDHRIHCECEWVVDHVLSAKLNLEWCTHYAASCTDNVVRYRAPKLEY